MDSNAVAWVGSGIVSMRRAASSSPYVRETGNRDNPANDWMKEKADGKVGG